MSRTHGLTDRQLEVALLKAAGHRHKEIAARLGISIRAVQCHVEAIVKAWGLDPKLDAGVQITKRLAA